MLCREISALISILQGRMVVFLMDNNCLASHFGLLSNLPGQTTSMQGAQVQNKIQSRDTET